MLKSFFMWIAVWILLFEEWLWDTLKVVGQKLAVTFHLQRIERFIGHCKPYPSLVIFVGSSFIVTPFNLYALYMIAHGLVVQGIILEIAMKLISTLIVSRVFTLTKPKLLQITWFEYCYNEIMTAINWAHAKIKQSNAYVKAQEFNLIAKTKYQTFKIRLKLAFT